MQRLTKTKIADAAWASDALADEGHTLPEIVRAANISFEDAMYVADQRAMRLILAQRGDTTALQLKRDAYEQQARGYRLTSSERNMMAMLQTIWLDSFTAGVRAANDASDTPRLLRIAAAALERADVGDADEAAAILRQMVKLDGTPADE